MKRSPNRPSNDRLALPIGILDRGRRLRAVTLRAPDEHRRLLLDVDFSGPRERAIGGALGARIERPSSDCLGRLTLADRHWLIAQLMLRDGIDAIEIAEACARCGGLLELRLDLAAVVRDAEPEMMNRVDGVRLPTVRDLERAGSSEEFLASCAPDHTGDLAEIEQALSDADPLGTVALNAACCLCGNDVRVEIDLVARWLAIAQRAAHELLEEVHALARHYHWSEREILALNESRRQYYIALCEAEHESDSLERQVYV